MFVFLMFCCVFVFVFALGGGDFFGRVWKRMVLIQGECMGRHCFMLLLW